MTKYVAFTIIIAFIVLYIHTRKQVPKDYPNVTIRKSSFNTCSVFRKPSSELKRGDAPTALTLFFLSIHRDGVAHTALPATADDDDDVAGI